MPDTITWSAGSFAHVLTPDVFREVFENIVGSYKADLTFVLHTNNVKDEKSTGVDYPVVRWVLPTLGDIQEAQILRDTITINLVFLDQTASDRPTVEMDRAHDRMAGIAKHIVRRFFDLYVFADGQWQGKDLDLELQGSISYVPVYDSGLHMLTGVGVSFTLKDNSEAECVDAYFE